MSGGFGTRPEELTAAAAHLDEAARVAADALAGLRATLGGLTDPVGTDDQGRAFAARYDPEAADGLAALGREADALRALGTALQASAMEYRAADDGTVAGFGLSTGG